MVLQVMPWLSQQDGPVHLDVAAERFNIAADVLYDHLTTVTLVGPQPQSPELMCEILLDPHEETVEVTVDPYFDRPARLTPEEGLELISAGLSLAHDAPEDDPLLSAVNKIAERFEIELGDELVVETRTGALSNALDIKAALQDRANLEINYLSMSRSELTKRVISPLQVFHQYGYGYVHAWCHKAQAVRTFRLDRIDSFERTGDLFDPEKYDTSLQDRAYLSQDESFKVVLDLSNDYFWLVEQLPTLKVDLIPASQSALAGVVETDSSTTESNRSTKSATNATSKDSPQVYRLELAVSNLVWFQNLLLQLGHNVAVVASQQPLPKDFVGCAAKRILQRYN